MPVFNLYIYNSTTRQWTRAPLDRQSYTIGRTPDNDIVLDNSLVSRQHARLQVDARGVWIMDLNTTNGVLVNQARIAPGQWALLPPNAPFSIGDIQMRLDAAPTGAPAAQSLSTAQVSPSASPKKRSWLPLVGALGALFLCLCLIVAAGFGVWQFYPSLLAFLPGQPTQPAPASQDQANGLPAASPTPEPLSPPQAVEALPAPAGGAPVQDSHGVTLSIPADSLPADQPASLESSSFSPGMQQALEKAYKIESLAYSVSTNSPDTSGRASLSLPAPSPDSRLAVLLDDKYAGVLDIQPQNGRLVIDPFINAPLAASPFPTLTVSGIPNRYFVVTPKTSGSRQPAGVRQFASYPQAVGDPEGWSCITEFWIANHCWRNPAGTIYVFWEDNVPADLAKSEYLRIIDMIKSVEAIMQTYTDTYHFTNSRLSASRLIYIIIDPSEEEPTYSQKTHNIYLNWKTVGTITSQENHCALAHELMHYTEHAVYYMNFNVLSNPKAWWLEMAAENGSYMIDPACVDRNLITYGKSSTKDGLLPLQSEALKWTLKEGARYIQALQVYISMCSGGANCGLSQDEFVAAINSGGFPFDNGSVLSAYQRSSKDMGLFLLGTAPAEARSDAHLPAVAKEGAGFAEYIWLKAVPNYKIDVSTTNNQIQVANHEATIKANIAQGGEYPLWISNGRGTPGPGGNGNGFPSLPALLKIDAGSKLWYALDDGAPIFHDGSKELTLGPLSDKLGNGLLRLVAVAPDAASTFSAKLSPLDLTGDWSGQLSAPSVKLVDCPNASSDTDKNGFNPNGVEKLDMLSILSAYGTYEADPAASDGSHYIWQGALPEGVTGDSDITLFPDRVEVKYHVNIPEPASSALFAALFGNGTTPAWPAPAVPRNRLADSLPLLILASLAIMSALALRRLARAPARLRQPGPRGLRLDQLTRAASLALVGLALVAAAAWLSGCVGISFWGSLEGTYTFNKLEYIDPQAPAAPVVPGGEAVTGLTWKLHQGKFTNNLDLFVKVSSTDSNGVDTSETSECKFTVNSAVEGFIGPADMVNLESNNK